MMLRLLLTLLLGLWASESYAAMCDVRSATPTFTDLTAMGLMSCDTSGNMRVTIGTLISGEDQANDLIKTSGGSVRQTTMASSVTTNTTSSAVALPVGSKSIYGQIVGTGAVTQTQAIYGDVDNDAANGILLCTLTLSGTTRTQDACPVITANFSYYYVTTTNTTGTSATGAIYAMY